MAPEAADNAWHYFRTTDLFVERNAAGAGRSGAALGAR
jgi:hypothetical protein